MDRNTEYKVSKRNYYNLRNKDTEKAIFWGVKYLAFYNNWKELSLADLEIILNEFDYIEKLISRITFNEFIQLFPIIKEYDGYRYECKDYFSTMDYLKTVELDQVIGENTAELLDNYYNNEIINFLVHRYCTFDEILKKQGQPTLIEGFLKMVAK